MEVLHQLSKIDRLSLGVQTFDNNILKKLNRIHTAEMAISAIEEIKKVYNNYSIDLMFGTPGSTKKSIENDLFILKKLNPPHVSIYNMTLEKRTVFYKLFKNFSSISFTSSEISNKLAFSK